MGLKLLRGVFGELVRRGDRSSAADRLAEEGVVVVRAVDNEGIESAALSGKADIAAAYVEGDAWSKKHEINEVAAVGGEVFNRHIVYRGAHLATGGFDDGRLTCDSDRFPPTGDGQRERKVETRAYGQCNLLAS